MHFIVQHTLLIVHSVWINIKVNELFNKIFLNLNLKSMVLKIWFRSIKLSILISPVSKEKNSSHQYFIFMIVDTNISKKYIYWAFTLRKPQHNCFR